MQLINELINGATTNILDGVISWLTNSALKLTVQIFDLTYALIGWNTNMIQTTLTQTPETWNKDVYEAIGIITTYAINPIAGVMITFVFCYEIYQMVAQQNSFQTDGYEVSSIIKLLMKMGIATFLLSKVEDITMAFFDLGAWVISKSNGLISLVNGIAMDDHVINPQTWFTTLFESESGYEISDILIVDFALVPLALLTLLAIAVLCIISVTVLGGRFIEIYMYLSVAPIMFATLGNQETSQMGKNYIKNIIALAFQGFFLYICVAIYSTMVSHLDADVSSAADFAWRIVELLGASFVLGTTMYKSRSISMSIFNAH